LVLLQSYGRPAGLMDLFVHDTEAALPDGGRVDRTPIAGAAALFMLQKQGGPLFSWPLAVPGSNTTQETWVYVLF
jgi:hypothetical protein